MSEEFLEEYPEVESILAPLAESLDSEVMRQLNYQVDIERQSVAIVAHNYLVENGFWRNKGKADCQVDRKYLKVMNGITLYG